MGISRILDIGMSGLYSAGAAMQTSSHNIANVNTSGFSRQSVQMGTRAPLNLTYGMLGGGADVTSVRRMTDMFLVGRMRDQTSQLSYQQQLDTTLGDIEILIGTADGNHIGTALDEFFASWSELSTPPITSELRVDVLNKGVLLANDLNTTSASLDDLATELDSQIEASVATLNMLLDGIADLNQQIMLAEGPGDTANDLRDRRDMLLAEISNITKVDVLERDDGTIDVVLSGRTIVVRGEAQHLDLSRNADGYSQLSTGNRHHAFELNEGQLAGLMESRDEKVIGAREQLDAVTEELIERLNAIHVQGQTQGGSGLMFFTGSTAGDIAVNTELIDRPEMVAVSRTGLSGDSDIAREIAGLGQQNPMDGQRTISRAFGEMLTGLASDAVSTRLQLESQEQVVQALESRLESVRGVSLDEEAANMARFQNAYTASAKVVAAAQDMFDTILQMI